MCPETRHASASSSLVGAEEASALPSPPCSARLRAKPGRAALGWAQRVRGSPNELCPQVRAWWGTGCSQCISPTACPPGDRLPLSALQAPCTVPGVSGVTREGTSLWRGPPQVPVTGSSPLTAPSAFLSAGEEGPGGAEGPRGGDRQAGQAAQPGAGARQQAGQVSRWQLSPNSSHITRAGLLHGGAGLLAAPQAVPILAPHTIACAALAAQRVNKAVERPRSGTAVAGEAPARVSGGRPGLAPSTGAQPSGPGSGFRGRPWHRPHC